MADLLGITWLEALAVALGTAGVYLALLLIVRILGQRVLSGMSSFDLVAVIAFGSVLGRAALGESPRLAGGVVALLTLVVLQAITGQLRSYRFGARAISNRPVLLMAGEQVCEENLQRCHVHPSELQSRLRLAGVRNPGEVAAVVMEPSGAVSVLKRGEPIDPRLLSGVVGGADVPQELLGVPGDRG
ncbi:DUF421 domain-containing protein [Propionibacteriaceae bacterium Y2011]|uniref:DUF421 domain-containing protein n=1 Tax=Microlunatus sp. Y2014 TaxID=3418488 RepID=UPI003B48CD1D